MLHSHPFNHSGGCVSQRVNLISTKLLWQLFSFHNSRWSCIGNVSRRESFFSQTTAFNVSKSRLTGKRQIMFLGKLNIYVSRFKEKNKTNQVSRKYPFPSSFSNLQAKKWNQTAFGYPGLSHQPQKFVQDEILLLFWGISAIIDQMTCY